MKYEENDVIELKREMVDDLDKEIIAFLNTNGGTIYIGVDDEGNVVGIPNKLKDEYDLKVSSIITHNIEPNCREFVSYCFNKDNVLEIKVKKGNHRPYYLTSKGPRPVGTYLRVGRSSRQAKPEEIIHLIMNDGGYSFEKDISQEQNLTFNYMYKASKDTNLKFSEDKFKTLHLINEDNLFTNLALRISDQNPIVVKFAVYDTNMNFIVKEQFTGSIVSIAERLLKTAELYNFTSATITPGQIARIEKICYPGASLREAIINAICHADYTMPSNIKVEFFIDKVRIISPGDVYNATLEAILKNAQTYRNPGLVNILYRLKFIENFGSGIPRIKEAYANETIKPLFEVVDKYFFVELNNTNRLVDDFFNTRVPRDVPRKKSENVRFHRNNAGLGDKADLDQNVPRVPRDVPHDVPRDQQDFLRNIVDDDVNKIILAIKNNKKITKKELSQVIGKSYKTVRRIIKEHGKIHFIGNSKSGYWKIEDK